MALAACADAAQTQPSLNTELRAQLGKRIAAVNAHLPPISPKHVRDEDAWVIPR